MKKDITRLFCFVDDFLKALEEEKADRRWRKVEKTDKNPWSNRKRNSDNSADVSRISVSQF